MEYLRFNSEAIAKMDLRYRAAFINSLGGFKSAVLIGTRNKDRGTNLAIFNSLFHIGASPPLCGLIFRPDRVARHTLENIMDNGQYTVNHIHEGIFRQAHQTGARYDREISEFHATGLDTEYHEGIVAPYVRQSHLKFGMQMEQRIDLAINGTVLLIGRIMDVFMPGECLDNDGFVDIERAGSLTVSGLDSYHATIRLGRLTYPKTDSIPNLLNKDPQ